MLKFKKLVSLVLVVVMAVSVGCVSVLAADEIPADLPEGTIKIAEGIYAYTPKIATYNRVDKTNIGTVPGFGNIIQPAKFSNIIVEQEHDYIRLKCSQSIRVNFVHGTQSIFGTNLFDWPAIGGDFSTTYYIEADYYNIHRGVGYQLQCTSTTDSPKTNTELEIWTSKNH